MKTNANRIIVKKKKKWERKKGREREKGEMGRERQKDEEEGRKEGRKKYLVSEKCKWRSCFPFHTRSCRKQGYTFKQNFLYLSNKFSEFEFVGVVF